MNLHSRMTLDLEKKGESGVQFGPVAYGTWSGGRFMHFGETLSEAEYIDCIRQAFEEGIRTFITSDVYGKGQADLLLGQALCQFPRDSYNLVGMVGHDFYFGNRKGNAGYPRFTDPELRSPDQFDDFLELAATKSLKRCQSDHFDLLLLHNPDELGYTREEVWTGMNDLKKIGITRKLGIAPGPANGFTLDLIHCYENFGEVIDWSMVILNPLEPWPANIGLPAAKQHGVKIMTRVVDHGGIFNDELKPGHEFREGDHRSYRPAGWVERGCEFVEKIRPLAESHGLSLLEYAAAWNLSHPAVECVIPTFIQENGDGAIPIREKIRSVARLTDCRLSPEEVEKVRQIGDNTGCMPLKGASTRHAKSERCDEWPMRPELIEIAERYGHALDW
ncbi:MAG: aldo/keto reductase [Verrucomicrobiales bacterium]|nr:aldo/keto reductase [Verrucomicrobiales bacterium]